MQFRSPSRNVGPRQLFPRVQASVQNDTDARIKELENELALANETILKLKFDLEVKDKAKAAEELAANQGFCEASKDLIDCLRAHLAECEHIKSRLFYQTEVDKKRIKILEGEKWRIGDKLSLEIHKSSRLSEEAEKSEL